MGIENKIFEPIDFVITWVDGSDPEWIKSLKGIKEELGDSRESLFRDMETLRFWFRGIEKFAPWVNKVYFVTCGQHPDWLNHNHPKLVQVSHEDFIPNEYLPTFSSQAIEVNLHRISGLNEQFVYFNDDMFLTSRCVPEDFFFKGLPCDTAVMNYAAPRKEPLNLVPFVNAAAINRNFDKSITLKNNFGKFYTPKYGNYIIKNIQFLMGKWFPGFKYFHIPSSMLKQTYSEIWEKESELMDRTSRHKLRVLTDANQWLFQNWQICCGKFYPRNPKIGKYISIDSNESLNDAVDSIKSKKYKMICANDAGFEDFKRLKRELGAAFITILPDRSEYELF